VATDFIKSEAYIATYSLETVGVVSLILSITVEHVNCS
jgi:hypothetical protein